MTEPAMNVLGPGEDGGRPAEAGYDHAWYRWSPLPDRPRLEWPDGARVAVCLIVNLGAVEWERDGQPLVPPPGGRGIAGYPDFPRMSHREFGHRVGVFRVLDITTRLGIPVAAAVDVLTAEHYAPLIRHLRPATAEFLSAGLSASRPITSMMTADEERDYILRSMDRLETALGTRPAGWLGPEHSESHRTPALLADAGVGYVLDWCNDDRPYPFTGTGSGLWSCPVSWELSDLSAMFVRDVSPRAYAASLVEALDVLCAEATRSGSGRMLGLHLYPWVSGQAFRADQVDAALARIRADRRVWMASPGEIVQWCRRPARAQEGTATW